MTNKLEEAIKEEVVLLPEHIQKVINNSAWVRKCEDIGRKHLLSDEEINALQAEVAICLVGLEDAESLDENIENRVGTSKEEAKKVTEEIFQGILIPISLKMEQETELLWKNKKTDAVKNLQFITSGGDYSAFLDIKKSPETASLPKADDLNKSNPGV